MSSGTASAPAVGAGPPAPDQGLVTQEEMPEILRQIQAAFDANVDVASEIRISRMAILQPGSPEVKNEIPGYKQGMIVDSITREPLTDYIKPPWLLERGVAEAELKPVHCCLMIPVFKLPTEYIEWIPRLERKEGDDRWRFKTLDKKDPRVIAGVWASLGGVFGKKPEEKGKAPPVTDNVNYLSLVVDLKTQAPKANFIVLTCAKSSAEVGKQLTTAIAANKMQGFMPWGRAFWLYTNLKSWVHGKETDSAFVYQIARGPASFDIVNAGTKAEILAMARALSQPASGHLLQVAMINAAELESVDGGVDAGGGEGGVGGSTLDEDPFQNPPEGQAGETPPAKF